MQPAPSLPVSKDGYRTGSIAEWENKNQHGSGMRRSVIERAHGRLIRYRRLLVRRDKHEDTHLAMLPMPMSLPAREAIRTAS